MMLEELRRAAEARGIATTFTDATGRRHEVPEATLEAVLEAMGPAPAAAAWPPVVVARAGQPATWSPPEGEPATLVLESGQERPLPAELPGDLPSGRHRVEGRTGATTLVVAPGRCHLPAGLEAGGRAWGWAAQLYAVRSRASWGIGDLGDLAGLLTATAPLGAGFALLNPLHAAMPTEPSPYNPSSRVFRNPLYLRIEDVPELASLDPGDRVLVERLAGAGRGLLDQDRIDRPAVYRLKDMALRLAHGVVGRDPEPGAVRHLLRPPARPRPGLAGLAGRLPPYRPARGGGVRRPAPPGGRLPRLAPVADRRAAGRRWDRRPRAARGHQRPGHRVRPRRVRRLDVPGRAGRRHVGRGPARPARPLRSGLGPAGVRARPAGRRRLRPVRPDHPGRHGPRRRAAHRPRDGAVPAVLDPPWGRAGPGHLCPLPGRRPARDPGPGERGRRGPGRGRGPGHGRARGAGAPGRRGRALLPAGLVRARPRRGPPARRRLPPAGPGRHPPPPPSPPGPVLSRHRPGPPPRHRGRHPGRGRAGRPAGPAREPVPAAGGRGPAGAGRAVGPGDRGRPLRLPHPDPLHAGRGHPGGRGRGPRPAQRARHHRPAPELVAAAARPARRAGRRPQGPAAGRDPLRGDGAGIAPKLRASLRELAARAGYDHPRTCDLAGQA